MGFFITVLAVLLSASVGAGGVVFVPNPVSPQAVFEAVDPASTPLASGSFVARGADGARMVVGKAAVITATLDSQITTIADSDGAGPRVALNRGGFDIQVGSVPVLFALDSAMIEAKSARLQIARVEEVWLVKAVWVHEQGTVRLREPAWPGTASTSRSPATSSPSASREIGLGQILGILPGGKAEPYTRSADPVFKTLSSRLTPGRSKPLLALPVGVEDMQDLAVQQTSADNALEDIEIQEIEIEVGCVEICVD